MTELRQVRLFKVELPAGLEADGVDDEVGVDVLAVRVGGHDDLVVLPLLSAKSPAIMQRTAETRVPFAFLVSRRFEG